VLNKEDIKYETQPYTRLKFAVFLFAYILLVIEIFLEYLMFYSIEPQELVDCCGVIFSSSSGSYLSYLLGLDFKIMLSVYYLLFIALVVSFYTKSRYIYSILNIFFIFTSLVTLIAFFGTYIYELPTHKCPFCFLQKDYSYIGYLIYLSLFIGTFNGIVISLVEVQEKELRSHFRVSLLFNTIYILIVTAYPILFYIKNGVLL